MSNSDNALEFNVEADLIARLTTGGVSNPVRADQLLPDPSYPAVAVQAEATPDNEMSAGQIPGGWYRVDVSFDCMTDLDDDKDRTALKGQVKLVRDSVLLDDILALLNSASTYNTYWGLQDGAATLSTEGLIHHHALSMTFQVCPISGNTTTSTTTTTTTTTTGA